MMQMPMGQYRPGNTFFHRADAKGKLLGLCLVIAAVIVSKGLIGCIAAAAAALTRCLRRLVPTSCTTLSCRVKTPAYMVSSETLFPGRFTDVAQRAPFCPSYVDDACIDCPACGL